MLTKLFFPDVPGVRVDRLWRAGRMIHIEAGTTRHRARCPLCHRRSRRIHRRYERTIADVPCGGEGVMLHLHVRRFVCRVRWCRRKIFTERVPALAAPSARRSARLRDRLQRDGFDLGGEAGARHATAEGMPVSARTLLRLVRAAPGGGPRPGPWRRRLCDAQGVPLWHHPRRLGDARGHRSVAGPHRRDARGLARGASRGGDREPRPRGRVRPGGAARGTPSGAGRRSVPPAQECDPLAAELVSRTRRLPRSVVSRVTTVDPSVGAIPIPRCERRNSAAPRSETGHQPPASGGPNGAPGRMPRSPGL